MRPVWAACLFVLLSASLALGSTKTLTLLYTGDLHAHLEHLESLANLIAIERAAGLPTILLDAGDAWHDFRRPVFAAWGGERVAAWMSEVGYDAMAVGNHELYLGADRLDAMALEADFPLVAGNLQSTLEFPPFLPYEMIAIAGLEVCIVGLAAPDCFPALQYPWLRPEDPGRSLARILSGEAPQRADLVVVLGHVSPDEAVQIVSRVPGIDVFVAAESDQPTRDPVQAGGALVVQAGKLGDILGKLVVEIDPEAGTVRSVENAHLPAEESSVSLAQGYWRLAEIVLGVALFSYLLLR